jgi:hypothetical protein
MNEPKIDRKLMMDYLLDYLTPEVKENFEEKYFSNDEIFGELLAVNEELAEMYRKKELSDKDRKRFEEKYLRSKRGISRMEFEKALMEKISQIQERPFYKRWLVAASDKVRQWFAEKTPVRMWQLATAGATIILLAVVARFWLFQPSPYSGLLVRDAHFIYQTSDSSFLTMAPIIKTRGTKPTTLPEAPVILTELDRYAVEIQPASKIFLYVFQWDTSGNMALVFPSRSYPDIKNPLQAGRIYRIPPSPSWFALDRTPGIETIGIGASSRPWEEMEREVKLLDAGSQAEKRNATAEIKRLLVEAEKSTRGEYYGRQFTFKHELKGGW